MTRTITAMYDSRTDAEEAQRQLQSSGLSEGDISIVDQGSGVSGTTTSSTYSDGGESRGFFGALKDMFMPDEDRHAYSEGLRRGGFLLTARVDEDRSDEAIRMLDTSNAVDFENRTNEWRSGGWNYDSDTTNLRGEETEAFPLAEEPMRVGRREVERGTVRVRSYVEETPAHDDEDSVGFRDSQNADRSLTDESRTFRDQADHSISMDAEGGRINETEEERRLRLERDGDMRP